MARPYPVSRPERPDVALCRRVGYADEAGIVAAIIAPSCPHACRFPLETS
jgi:hypothetical protein